jgi:hypothetical protein
LGGKAPFYKELAKFILRGIHLLPMQVKEHVAKAIQDLQLPYVVKPVKLLFGGQTTGSTTAELATPEEHRTDTAAYAAQHTAACTKAYRLLAEANMGTPSDVHAAMRAFSKALPALPPFGKMVPLQEESSSSSVSEAVLSQEVLDELMKVTTRV